MKDNPSRLKKKGGVKKKAANVTNFSLLFGLKVSGKSGTRNVVSMEIKLGVFVSRSICNYSRGISL